MPLLPDIDETRGEIPIEVEDGDETDTYWIAEEYSLRDIKRINKLADNIHTARMMFIRQISNPKATVKEVAKLNTQMRDDSEQLARIGLRRWSHDAELSIENIKRLKDSALATINRAVRMAANGVSNQGVDPQSDLGERLPVSLNNSNETGSST